MRIHILVFFLFIFFQSRAQFEVDSSFLNMTDTTQFFQSKSTLDPSKAALYSAILPGLGQAYNRQLWKVPIIYGGVIAFAHFINYNHEIYNQFRSAEIAIFDNRPETVNPLEAVAPGRFSDQSIRRNRELFRRNRDFLIILAGAMYLLQIAEAHIAAHLKEFDVNESLSVSIVPSIQSSPLFSRSTGVSFVIAF